MLSVYARTIRFTLLLTSLVAFVVPARADERQELRDRLQKFKANPAMQMQVLPKKSFESGEPARKSLFSAERIAGNNFVEDKNSEREKFCKVNALGVQVCVQDGNGRRGMESNDKPEDLIDNPTTMLNTLEKMEEAKLMKAALPKKTQPWSDNYWPIYQGILGARYSHPNLPSGSKFKDFFDFKESLPMMSFITERPEDVNMLSPSEKYDLLIGDTAGTLTTKMWAQGQEYARRNRGKVETWMGICHGWAPAAYMLDRPEKAVEVPVKVKVGRRNKEVVVTFYPSDIKALGSYLWAQSGARSRFVGGRCNEKNPARAANGAVKDADCFDTNPATWHMAVVNQIGKSQRSFVMDATYDYEVWNQPVVGYKYTYFNPETMEPVNSLAEAKVSLRKMTDDKFKGIRKNPKAKYLVGVSMKVSYTVETQPSDSLTDSYQEDSVTNVTYEYDLELNARGEIIGGEWYTDKHPDFLWTPAPKARAVSNYDEMLNGSWDGQSVLPEAWMSAAQSAAQNEEVLAGVVEGLIKAARK